MSNQVITQQQSVLSRWNNVDTLIRDRKIPKDDAIDSLSNLVTLTIEYCKNQQLSFTPRNEWVYPMAMFTKISYRDNGKDFRTDYFDYFEGAEFYGHPAHDVFILDKDSNSIEDSTGKYVYAVAMASGVIITAYDRWRIGDKMRAGNYVNLFDPQGEGVFYYSHLDSVFVKSGDIVRAGEVIGYVGRTGRKAVFGKTHIHISYYKITNGYPEPIDIIKDLYRAERVYRGKEF